MLKNQLDSTWEASPLPAIVIVPGWRDSGPGHWQSLWAEQLPGAVRVSQDDWLFPSRAAWVASIAASVLAQPGPVVLVAHSLESIVKAFN